MNIKKSELPKSYEFFQGDEVSLYSLIANTVTKEALLAIAYSFALQIGEMRDGAEKLLLHEWDLMASNGACKSKPPMWMLKAAGVKPV